MFKDLLASIEADINQTAATIQMLTQKPTAVTHEIQLLLSRKQQLADLAMDYIQLENRYREVAQRNSVY